MHDVPLTPEQELLLLCARTRLDEAQESRIQGLAAGGLDWPFLLRIGERNAILPLLYHHLSATCWTTVPVSVQDALLSFFQHNRMRSLRLSAELVRLLRLVQASEIPAIPYKGPLLAASLYGDVTLREYWDLDVVVHPRDVLRLKELMLASGYQPGVPLEPAQEKSLLRYGCEAPFRSPDGLSIVEVHWRITARNLSLNLDAAGLWTGLQSTSLSGTTMPQFSAENHLLVLCVHGGKHAWKCLLWVCDIAELLRKERGLNWDLVVQRARLVGAERLLLLGLLLAKQLLGAPAWPGLDDLVRRDPALQSLAAEARQNIFRDGAATASSLQPLWFFVRSRERLADRVRCLAGAVLMPELSDWEAMRLPSAAHGLYPLVRVVRLLGKYGLGWARGTPNSKSPKPGAEPTRDA